MLLGLLGQGSSEWFKGAEDPRIDELVSARTAAKKNRDFAEADRIRDELAAEGIALEDSASGTIWRRL